MLLSMCTVVFSANSGFLNFR